MNLEDIEKLEGWDLTTSQYNALLEIYKHQQFQNKLVILSAPKGSGKSFLLEKVLSLSENTDNFIIHDSSNNDIDYEVFDKFSNTPFIAIDNGGSDNQWFRSLKKELKIYKIGFCIVSSYVNFIPDFPIVKFELNDEDKEIFQSICGRNNITVKDSIDSYNLHDYFL